MTTTKRRALNEIFKGLAETSQRVVTEHLRRETINGEILLEVCCEDCGSRRIAARIVSPQHHEHCLKREQTPA